VLKPFKSQEIDNSKVKVTLCQRAPRRPIITLFNFMWFRFQAVQERVLMTCMPVIWYLKC